MRGARLGERMLMRRLLAGLSGCVPLIRQFWKMGYAVVRETKAGGLDYRAMSLVYTSLMALVPLLAVSFSILKSFGAETYLEPFLLQTLEPLGDRAGVVAAKILDAVRHLKVGVLGFLGMIFLFYVSVSLLEKIEESFNHIWRVRAARNPMRRFADYLSFTLLGPLVVFSAFGGMSALLERHTRNPWLRGWFDLVTAGLHALLPYAFIIAAFSAAYLYIPNVNVKPKAALVGGVVAGLAWKLAGWLFAAFVAGSTQYNALYSSFAILVLFMIWLYVSWLILLAGGQVSFFCQHPRYIRLPPGHVRLSGRLLEQLGIAILVLIGRAFLRGEPAWTVHRLAEHLDLPDDCVEEVLDTFTQAELLLKARHRQEIYLPARDLAAIGLADAVAALRGRSRNAVVDEWADTIPPTVVALQSNIDEAVADALALQSLRDLCDESQHCTGSAAIRSA